MTKHKSVEWAVSGHGGSATQPSKPPDMDSEVVEARIALRKAEASYYSCRVALREAIARAEGRKQ